MNQLEDATEKDRRLLQHIRQEIRRTSQASVAGRMGKDRRTLRNGVESGWLTGKVVERAREETMFQKQSDRVLEETQGDRETRDAAAQVNWESVSYIAEDGRKRRNGYVNWGGSCYGVSWWWSGRAVQTGLRSGIAEIRSEDQRLAVLPMAHMSGQRRTVRGQRG